MYFHFGLLKAVFQNSEQCFHWHDMLDKNILQLNHPGVQAHCHINVHKLNDTICHIGHYDPQIVDLLCWPYPYMLGHKLHLDISLLLDSNLFHFDPKLVHVLVQQIFAEFFIYVFT